MGQAKRRGTYEERKAEAIQREHEMALEKFKQRQFVASRRGKGYLPTMIALSIALGGVKP